MKYNFDEIANGKMSNSRKWDIDTIRQTYPNVKDDFIPVWIADMDYKAAPEIRRALEEIVNNGAYGYASTSQRWYDAVINWQLVRHNNLVEQEWLTLGYGTVTNMHIAVQAFTKENDCVLILTPVYGPFKYSVEDNNRRCVEVPLLLENNRYEINWDYLEKAIRTQKPKLMFFCNPHNPSGRIWTRAETERVARLCKENDVILVSDEVHSEYIMNGSFCSSLQIDTNYLDNLIVLMSPNKGFNLGGLKLSYSIIPNEKIRDQFRKQYIKDDVTSPNVTSQVAMITAYEQGEEWLDECKLYLKENLKIFTQYIDESFPGWKMMKADASYLPWVNVSESGFTMEEVGTMMADEAGVVISTGNNFVSNGREFLRFNLGTSHQLLRESMERMVPIWEKYYIGEVVS